MKRSGTTGGDRWNIALLEGGDSAEREISLRSGEAVARALAEGAHAVRRIDPGREPLESVDWSGIDVVFIALHGTFGEDGQVQQIMEDVDLPYTGSGPAASHRAFHKMKAKELFETDHLPTPEWHLLPRTASPGEFQAAAARIGQPLVVKPEAQGSSLGISLVEDASELADAVALAGRFDHQILLERAVAGDEWTVPLLDDDVLTPIRISTSHEFFDFSAKYQDHETRYEPVDERDDETARRLAALSLRACRLLGTRGICRVDLRVDPEGNPWLLEVNTVPGLTDHSLVPKSAQARGWSMRELCERAIRSAFS